MEGREYKAVAAEILENIESLELVDLKPAVAAGSRELIIFNEETSGFAYARVTDAGEALVETSFLEKLSESVQTAPAHVVTAEADATKGKVIGGGVFAASETVTLTAVPEEGYEFAGWSGDASGTSDSLELTVDSAKAVQAIFAPKPHSWALAKDHGSNWRSFDWFGYYHDPGPGRNWIYHSNHGWLYRVSDTTEFIWLFDSSLGWLWTTADAYPFLYSHSRKNWLYYVKGSSRLLWDYSANEWIVITP